MCDDDIHPGTVETDLDDSELTPGVVTRDVMVPMAEGVCDAVLFHPEGEGRWPAVLIWPDVMGLKPAFRKLGARLAAAGYVVLVPNPYWRVRRAPIVAGAVNMDDMAVRVEVFTLAQQLTDEGADADSGDLLSFLDAQPQTLTSAKAGVHGYCMGGRLAFRTAATRPMRIGAVGSFHGFGLVTVLDSSVHRLIGAAPARYLVAIARNDDAAQPEQKQVLRDRFAVEGVEAKVEVYPADHGWCVEGVSVYDHGCAERAWSELELLYAEALN